MEDFHFLKYTKYAIYDWIRTLFCCELEWEDCQQIDAARDEASNQIDARHLLRRIAHLEEANKNLMSEDEDMCLYLKKNKNVTELQSRRKILSYYDKMTGEEDPLTIEDL